MGVRPSWSRIGTHSAEHGALLARLGVAWLAMTARLPEAALVTSVASHSGTSSSATKSSSAPPPSLGEGVLTTN